MGARTHETDSVAVPVMREQLQVGTRVVDSGRGVRLHKQVVTEQQAVAQPLWRERIDIRHVAGDALVDQPPAARYEGDTLVVPVIEEVLVKRYRVREELHITSTPHTELHTDTVTLRSEQLVVERFDENTP